MKTDDLREAYLGFFAARNHVRVASDSLVPQNDASLLFTGAGMNQFKDNFLGIKKDLRRAASSQKCLRTGDLERVGHTAFHHSFFEMLGNFSFGDYFKEEAIVWAWEFLTVTLKIPQERLRVTVHRSDEEAFRIWKERVKIKESWIYRLGDHSNFWPANAPGDHQCRRGRPRAGHPGLRGNPPPGRPGPLPGQALRPQPRDARRRRARRDRHLAGGERRRNLTRHDRWFPPATGRASPHYRTLRAGQAGPPTTSRCPEVLSDKRVTDARGP